MSFHNHDPESRPFKRTPQQPVNYNVPLFGEWVSVKKRLPDENVSVLVFIPEEDEHITTGMWDVSKKWVLLDEYRVPKSEVTYWMYCPDKPNDRSYTPSKVNTDELETMTETIARLQKRIYELEKQ